MVKKMASRFRAMSAHSVAAVIWIFTRRSLPSTFRVSGWLVLDLIVVLGALYGSAAIGGEAGAAAPVQSSTALAADLPGCDSAPALLARPVGWRPLRVLRGDVHGGGRQQHGWTPTVGPSVGAAGPRPAHAPGPASRLPGVEGGGRRVFLGTAARLCRG